jgi:hypothetical protein
MRLAIRRPDVPLRTIEEEEEDASRKFNGGFNWFTAALLMWLWRREAARRAERKQSRRAT